MIVGARYNDSGGDGAGRAYVFSGSTGNLLCTFTGEAIGDYFGWSVSGAGDVNGDGTADLIVGSERHDTGGNDADVTPAIFGRLVQVAYQPGDTGVRADTGAEVTLTADTGGLNLVLAAFHLAPNTRSWARAYRIPTHDTGGDALLYAAGGTGVHENAYLAGERITASVQGIATDTGKDVNLFVYSGV